MGYSTIIDEFRSILKRIQSPTNSEKYHSICIKTCSEDEERLWKLCEAFWPPEYKCQTPDIEKTMPNPNLDHITAKRYINEINELLDKLGWQ